MGLGHVMRCINLAKYLKKFSEISFLVEDYGGVKNVLEEHGFKNVKLIRKKNDSENDLKQTVRLIVAEKIDIIIIDKHDIKIKYLKHLRKFLKVVLITDLKKVNYPVDIVVNGFIGLKNRKFENKNGAICLTGPRYQILNPKFQKIKNVKKKYSILATFGGLDEKSVADIFLNSVEDQLHTLKIKLIIGPMGKKSRNTTLLEKKYIDNLKIEKETKDMHKEISKAEYGFTLGGITTYEFAALNVPFAVICDDIHQIPTAREWHRRGKGENLGYLNKKTSEKISSIIKKVINKKRAYSSRTNRVIDGLGVKRVTSEILKIVT